MGFLNVIGDVRYMDVVCGVLLAAAIIVTVPALV